MGKLLSSPKLLVIAIAAVAALLVSVAGGALGASFGLGFLGGPIPFISIPAERVAFIGSYPLLNSTIMFWVGGLVLLFVAWRAGRNVKDVPSGWQNLMEMIYEFFSNTVDGVAGGEPKSGRRFLALVSTIFLVVMIINWVGILPGVGSIGRIETIEEWVHHHVEDLEAEVHEEHPDYSPKQVHSIALIHLLEEHGDDTFVAFDGVFVWLGQGEQARVPLRHIVTFEDHELHDLADEVKHGEDISHDPVWERIEHDIHEGVVKEAFTYDLGGPSQTPYDFKGQTAGLLVPYLRGASTDVNTTLAIAIVAMLTVQIWGFRALGVRGYGGKFLVNPISQGPIATFVGVLEGFGELTRTISFTFRLFGNMFAGEILLIAMAFLLPLIGIIPFMGLELFVGVIQAYIFAMLTLVFGVMAVASHGDHDSHAEEH
ncbi:MAG: F0F1 ATP synthase subunit A [Dehalococcoidia bacterium]|nr:F0F1 ATP synthase subunit A [Dehalococcoidia bacterium]MDP7262050.1 F0F1 ATP synthase subunit A [Dehalococcoidia bacterium]